jgi:hypothetical protein
MSCEPLITCGIIGAKNLIPAYELAEALLERHGNQELGTHLPALVMQDDPVPFSNCEFPPGRSPA